MKSTDKMAVPRRHRYDRDTLAFLPAALEIVERPPSPIGRSIAIAIIFMFSLALTWAYFSKTDIIATARGHIVPVGDVKIIQPLETGIVRAVLVKDGQRVRAGDLLVELDPRINRVEQERLRSDLTAEELTIARLRAALGGGGNAVANFRPPPDADPHLVEMQRNFLISELAQHYAKLAALEDQLHQKQAEVAHASATIAKLEATIPITKQILQIRKDLVAKGYVSTLTYLETLQSLIESESDLRIQKAKMGEVKAAYSTSSDMLFEAESEYRSQLFAELAEAQRKAADLQHELKGVMEKARFLRLTSPVDGVVQQLAVHTIGGVVTSAERLLVVVPNDAKLEVEAMLPNRDIGFVHSGQNAEIKLDTFDFTRYGVLHGTVTRVSPDAVPEAQPTKGTDLSPATKEESSGSDKQTNYLIKIALDETSMTINHKVVGLRPGMAATVDIKTGSHSVLSYLLSPLLRYGHESLHER